MANRHRSAKLRVRLLLARAKIQLETLGTFIELIVDAGLLDACAPRLVIESMVKAAWRTLDELRASEGDVPSSMRGQYASLMKQFEGVLAIVEHEPLPADAVRRLKDLFGPDARRTLWEGSGADA